MHLKEPSHLILKKKEQWTTLFLLMKCYMSVLTFSYTSYSLHKMSKGCPLPVQFSAILYQYMTGFTVQCRVCLLYVLWSVYTPLFPPPPPISQFLCSAPSNKVEDCLCSESEVKHTRKAAQQFEMHVQRDWWGGRRGVFCSFVKDAFTKTKHPHCDECSLSVVMNY